MIRTLWVFLAGGAFTLFYGGWAIVSALVGRNDTLHYTRLTRSWARAIVRAAGTPVVVHGLEHIRPGEPQVIVSNHVSWFDIFSLASILPVPFHFVAKKELERIPLFGQAWKSAGHISIDRSNRQRALESLRGAGEKIRAEKSAVIIYPEGTRSRTGRLQPFKKGAFMLAIEAAVPIVPVVVTGSYDIMRPDRPIIRPAIIHLRFQPPIPAAGRGSDAAEELMEQVRRSMVGVLEEHEALPPLPE